MIRPAEARFKAIDHEDDFHQIVIGRGTGRLQHKDVFAAHVFVDFDHDFAVRESAKPAPCQAEMPSWAATPAAKAGFALPVKTIRFS